MKKLFTLAALSLLVATGSAQDKKTWDFTRGFSNETIANLEADPNWTVTYNDDGSFKQANEAKKLSGEFIANEVKIEELEGLQLGTAGLSNNNNVIIFPAKFRMNRNNSEIIFPKLKNGQTITIVGRSANSTAENRGIKAAYDYLKLIEGPEDNLIRASLGEVTLKWQVVTDEDEVDVKFTMITGGIDFTLFQIDEGDVVQATKVAYLYDGNEDQVLSYLNANAAYSVTPINVNTESVTTEGLSEYEVTIVAASVPADKLDAVKAALPWTPVLNLNGGLYTGEYGTAVETAPFIFVKSKNNTLYKDVELTVDEANGITAVVVNEDDAPVSAATLGEYFAGDVIAGVAINDSFDGANNDITTLHTHNINHNGYVFLPYNAGTLTSAALKLLDNAIAQLQKSKKEITASLAPTISQDYKDQQTIVTIKAPGLPKAKAYYTTDGSTPTVESTLYTEPFALTKATTVKAVAIAEGYTVSSVAELAIDIKSQPKTPAISYVQEDAKTTITLSCETEGVDLWYNFEQEATTDTLKSTKYTGDIIITMPQYVNAFAVADGTVWSEVASQRVLVQNPRVVIDVAAHYSAPQWTTDNNENGLNVANGKGMFSWGASAASMYTGEGTTTTVTDPETGDEIEVVQHSDEDLREEEVVNEPGDNPQWQLKSRGTCLIWQNTGVQTTNFGQDTNYNPAYSTDVDPLFPVTKNDIQFYKFQAGETPNGSIQTINKYQAPLDVVVLANLQGGPLLAQVSADGETWQTIGSFAKTGFARMWNKNTASYDGTDEVYVRVTMEEASAGAKVFDIYIANEGENSKALKEQWENELTGIAEAKTSTARVAAGIYTLNGVRVSSLQRGLNIVVQSDGTVRKVVVK